MVEIKEREGGDAKASATTNDAEIGPDVRASLRVGPNLRPSAALRVLDALLPTKPGPNAAPDR